MTAALKFLTGRIAGPLFGITSLALAVALGAMYLTWTWQVSLIERDRDTYKARIEDQETGLVRQVTQCLTNTSGLKESIADIAQNAKDREARDKARDEANQKSMAAAAKLAKGAFDNSAMILARPTATMPGTLASCAAGEKYLRGALP
jgi:hypothetical protein